MRRVYDPPRGRIPAGAIVIDVGANIGAFAVYAATTARGVTVHAYRPAPDNVHWLRRNVEESHLHNVVIRPQALSHRSESRLLRVCASNWIAHSLAEPGASEKGLSRGSG